MLGPKIAVGRTSEVYRRGNDAAVKLLYPHIPNHWAAVEATLTEAVRSVGIDAPRIFEVTTIDGRAAVIQEFVDGPSMWELMSSSPSSMTSLVDEFVQVQRGVHRAGIPMQFPGTVDRVTSKIGEVTTMTETARDEALDLLYAQQRGAALLHGDLHPGNVLMSRSGPVLIDWFDASVGHPLADIARTELLVGVGPSTDRRHLVDATDDQLGELHRQYLAAISDVVGVDTDELDRWRAITAVSRLAERTDDDVDQLIEHWNRYRTAGKTSAADAPGGGGSAPLIGAPG